MVRTVLPEELAAALREHPPAVVLLDVREPEERAIAAIEPSLFIPLQDVPARLDDLPRDQEIVVYCHHGTRSAMAASYLEHSGFPKVANLRGGIDAWSVDVDPSVARYS